jgi:hypothetical protein
MTTQNTQELQQFITDNNLKREDGIIVFIAAIDLHKSEGATSLCSEIQVITLPEEMALYILEFCEKQNLGKEMYRTRQHQFARLSQHELEILDAESDTRLKISLKVESNCE